MLIILSPSKTMDMSGALPAEKIKLKPQTAELIEILKTFSPEDLSKIMKIKGRILESVSSFYKNFDEAPVKKTIEAYTGFVFKGLELDSYSQEEHEFLTKHFAVLSALYGVLRADTPIREYRLDMTMKILRDKNLYDFWKEDINSSLKEIMKRGREEVLVNLASNEFSKLIDRKSFSSPVIDIDFREERDGKFKSVSTYAKKARGIMADYIIKNKIASPQGIKGFSREGYTFNEELSSDNKFIFTR